MNFTDYIFLPCLLITVLLYYISPQKIRWIILLAVSLLFYASWGVELLPFSFGAALVAWGFALLMQRRYLKQDHELEQSGNADKALIGQIKAKTKKGNLYLLWLAVIMILGVLIYTKTQKALFELPPFDLLVVFFSKVYRHLAWWGTKIPVISFFVRLDSETISNARTAFFVPLGISYYSMSLVGYLADVYWRKDTAERNFFKLLLFTIYFPKILEGPISRHRLISERLQDGHSFDYNGFCFGLQRMLWGYFKKLVIADRLALLTDPVFESVGNYGGSVLLISAIAAAFELYCDFSGCMDIALGASELFGIKLEENFNHPFFSKSAAEYWRRWHITLGTWFKDYIYMPLAASPKLIAVSGKLKAKFGRRASKAFITAIPLTVVWLMTGLWHGTGLNYVVWGIYWGLLIIISNIFAKEIKGLSGRLKIRTDSAAFKRFQMIRTFFLFVLSRIISVPDTLSDTCCILYRILFQNEPWHLFNGDLLTYGLGAADWGVVVLSLFLLYFVSRKQENGTKIREKIASYPLALRWTIYIVGITAVLIFGIYGASYNASSFVYMNY